MTENCNPQELTEEESAWQRQFLLQWWKERAEKAEKRIEELEPAARRYYIAQRLAVAGTLPRQWLEGWRDVKWSETKALLDEAIDAALKEMESK